ncbi:MAG TPA: transporter substrate-binding domain-containing protein, partial [Psychromonas hadalis]|nr:transporter substrate-binding domain-containing protein [Psychromonas hadalis]
MLEKIGLTKKHIKALLLILFALAITSLFTCAVTPPESLPKKEVAKVTNANQKEKGVLKVLTWAGRERLLSRQGLSHETELDHLKLFAESKGLNFEEVSVFRFSDLIPKLLAGEGDIISANLTITSERKKLLD